MKRNAYGFILIAEAILCLTAVFFRFRTGRAYWEASSFPFAQAGGILREMSLSGAAGNVAAVLLYAAAGLLPLAYLLYRIYKKRAKWEDALLGILSALLFAGLYLYINPGLFAVFMPMAGMTEGGRLMVSSCIWAVLAGYAVLRVLRSFEKTEREEKQIRYLIFLLRCIGAILVFKLCFLHLETGLETFEGVKRANTGAAEGQLFVTGLVTGLHVLNGAVAAALELWLLFCGERLLEALAAEGYSEETEKRAYRLYEACRITVFVSVICCVGMDLLQMLLGKWLLSSDFLVQIPLGAIALTLAVMVAARYVAQGRKLKRENDLFI